MSTIDGGCAGAWVSARMVRQVGVLCARINMTHLRVVRLNRGADKGDPVARGSDVVRLRDSTNVDVVLLLTAVNLSFATQAVASPDAPSGSLAVHRLASGGKARREGLLPVGMGARWTLCYCWV